MAMRSGLWRVTKPLFAASARSHGAPATRRFIGFTATRYGPPAASAVSEQAAGSAAAAAAPATPVEDEKPIDLKSVGAETSTVLTIADVLSRREQEFTQQGAGATYFDEWESIPATHTIQEAVNVMVECKMGSLIVTEDTTGIVGIVTERDVMTKTSPRAIPTEFQRPVKEITSSQIMCIPTTTTVIDALATMTKENIRHLAVINGDITNAVKKGSVPEEAMRCVLSIKDIIKAYSHFETQKKAALEPTQPAKDESKEAAAVKAPPATEVVTEKSEAASTEAGTDKPEEGATPAAEPATPASPAITAATLLKKKSKRIKLILNTRPEDNITVAEAIEEMTKNNFGSVLIVDKEQRVLGIFTERDYLTKVLYAKKDPTQVKVIDVCTKKLACLQIEDTLEQCWTLAAGQTFRHFPVIGTMRKDREKELAGILSIKDLVREISKGHETQSGFRLMDFFKSRKEKKEAPPAATPPPASPVATEGEEAKPAPEAVESKPESSQTASEPAPKKE
ncbi:hypothetical protein Poli38472_007484 [Pythium oligandrum]|uniref:CBS domain-containing protein n=1 Tax=Pythium oligandrum TaxID=41045 RepID=A0A8K1CS97_PYTOL|nr:hypothetical protein Poli38472_007484 [Pythium oligandrum]|eukprot:TMW67812.1 hypothetical protein Poli38472_007484 [Pythium oligandrum]